MEEMPRRPPEMDDPVQSDEIIKFDDQTLVAPIEKIDPLEMEQTPSLLMISGPQIGRNYGINEDEFMIGRANHCDLPIEDELVSRHHCKIVMTTEGAVLKDLGSTNGTLLNGRRIRDEVKLTEGDQVQVGGLVILRYHWQEEVEAKFLGSLYESATKDFLTSAYNKKFFIERLQEEFSHALRHQKALSVLIIDIDHFKKVNDTYGHLSGDIAIQKVAHHLMSHTRRDDIVSRFGGEEFVVLMRDIDHAQAHRLGEQLREQIEGLKIKSNDQTLQVTVSVGIASMNENNEANFIKFQDILEAADKRLYQAKESGRNKVVA